MEAKKAVFQGWLAKKRTVGCGLAMLLLLLVGAGVLFNHVSFARASERLREFCERHGGARARAPIPEGAVVALYSLGRGMKPMVGCDQCPNYLDDPRNISILYADWRDNPYAYTKSPATGGYLLDHDPESGGDWGPVGWYRFSRIREDGNQCVGRVIEMFDQPLDVRRMFRLEWRRYLICRTPAEFKDADFIYGNHAVPELREIQAWWMPPLRGRNQTIVEAKTHQPVVSVTVVGLIGDWFETFLIRTFPLVRSNFKGGCGVSGTWSPVPLVGRHAPIFEGVRIEYYD